MKRLILIFTIIGLLVLSCKKTDHINDNLTNGNLIAGKWIRSYSSVELVYMMYSITSWTDVITFEESHFGDLKIYRFLDLDTIIPFQYYTDNDTLLLQMDQNREKWTYSIRNDSLIMLPVPSTNRGYNNYRIYTRID